jgi:hypothetical protein
MFDLRKSPWRRFNRATTGVVSLAVVTTSMVALAAAGSAHAAPRPAAAPDAARVQAVRSAVPSATSLLNQARYTSRVSGTDAKGRKVTGRFVPRRAFVNSAGKMIVQGHLFARIHRANGTSFVRDQTGVRLPVISTTPPSSAPASRAAAAASCQILNLVLGPLDLNLLGLVVHLDTVHLNITAVPGAGNLLGNLLCAVAGLLDATPLSGLLGQLSTLLTSIFAILRA